MTAGQPPQPPHGGSPGQGSGAQPGSGAPPPGGYGPPPGSRPDGGQGVSVDLRRLRIADWLVVGGTLLYLVLAMFPWWNYGEQFFGLVTLSGFEGSGAVSSAFVLFLLASAWAVLPAFTDLRTGFPRGWVTVGLAAFGFLLTLTAWIRTFDAGFSVWALLGLATAAAILVVALLTLLPQLRGGPTLPGSLAGAARWANQPAPDLSSGPRPGPPGSPPDASPSPPPPPPGPARPEDRPPGT